jgi:hypothetical protein
VVKPDAFYLVPERRDHFLSRSECVPDLIVEVLAADTARRDRREKLSLYAELGVPEYWLIEPELSALDMLTNDHGRMVVTLPAGDRHPSPGLAGLILDLAELWRDIASHSLTFVPLDGGTYRLCPARQAQGSAAGRGFRPRSRPPAGCSCLRPSSRASASSPVTSSSSDRATTAASWSSR